jgi:hypothetical protein
MINDTSKLISEMDGLMDEYNTRCVTQKFYLDGVADAIALVKKYDKPAEKSCESCNTRLTNMTLCMLCEHYRYWQPRQPTPKGELQAKDLLPLLNIFKNMIVLSGKHSAFSEEAWWKDFRLMNEELAKLEG